MQSIGRQLQQEEGLLYNTSLQNGPQNCNLGQNKRDNQNMTGVQKEEEAIEPSIGYERVQSLNNVKITLKQGSVKMITPIMITESISKDVEVGIKGKSERVVNGGDMKNMLDLSPQKNEYKGSQVCRRVDEIEGRILQKD